VPLHAAAAAVINPGNCNAIIAEIESDTAAAVCSGHIVLLALAYPTFSIAAFCQKDTLLFQ
jgi:hypothetical protein